MLAGSAFGGLAIYLDPNAKAVILPYPHLQIDPSERVAHEEAVGEDRLRDRKTTFSTYLMTHNTRVSILLLALGMTWGVGTLIVLFSNGVILGAVVVDYVLAGETTFLVGWLLPHGAVELPACLLAGQAGLVLAGALIGGREGTSLKLRLRRVSGDLVTLICGVGVLLAWAGFVEAFLSQYHKPVIPYNLKIGFGVFEFFLLVLFLGKSGTRKGGTRSGFSG
jgi:uncharacterized membrane protein SpoIIM required for sporulation